eukprot:Filipodium_phascolosomae@DN1585_c0_g1_i1.p2
MEPQKDGISLVSNFVHKRPFRIRPGEDAPVCGPYELQLRTKLKSKTEKLSAFTSGSLQQPSNGQFIDQMRNQASKRKQLPQCIFSKTYGRTDCADVVARLSSVESRSVTKRGAESNCVSVQSVHETSSKAKIDSNDSIGEYNSLKMYAKRLQKANETRNTFLKEEYENIQQTVGVVPDSSSEQLESSLSRVTLVEERVKKIQVKLTPEEEKEVEVLLDESRDLNELIVEGFAIPMTREKLLCLNPRQWLNDEVMNLYLKLVQARNEDILSTTGYPTNMKPPSVFIFNTFFYSKVSGEGTKNCYDYASVRRWTTRSKVDIFSKDWVLFPIHSGGIHWVLGGIDTRNKEIHYWDSMHGKPPSNFEEIVRNYLADEHMDKKKTPLETKQDWSLVKEKQAVPMQQNGFDCGVFAISFAKCTAYGRPFDFNQSDMLVLRKKITIEIRNLKID